MTGKRSLTGKIRWWSLLLVISIVLAALAQTYRVSALWITALVSFFLTGWLMPFRIRIEPKEKE